jgi:hypothetical protein
LLAKMSTSFKDTGGDIKEVLITMVSSPEFWSKEALREKIKSPFELAISSLRCLNAQIDQPYEVYRWITKMGQEMYAYQPPTGFPDKAMYWINTGSLLNRMNFGLALATNRIRGIKLDLLALNNNHEPESAEQALLDYSKIIMPERDLDATIKRLTPMLNDVELEKKVDQAANKSQEKRKKNLTGEAMTKVESGSREVTKRTPPNLLLPHVVGIIIGSPEFQRR